MTRRLFRAVPFTLVALTTLARAQNLGSAPSLSIEATDVYTAFRLPPLKDTSAGGLISVLSSTQVGERATVLALNGQSPVDAWQAAQSLLQGLPATSPQAIASPALFSGATASDLNRFLAGTNTNVLVTSPSLTLDQPIQVSHSGVTLDLGHAVLTSQHARPYMLRIQGAQNVTVRGGESLLARPASW